MDVDVAYWWLSRALGSAISIGLTVCVTHAWRRVQRRYRQFFGCMALYFVGDVAWSIMAEAQDIAEFSVWWVILSSWVRHLAGVGAMVSLWLLYVETRATCAPAKVDVR